MAFRSDSTAGDSLGTTLAVPIPAGATTDDILILSFHAEGAAGLGLTVAFDVGSWTKITGASGAQNGSATPFELYRYWARWGTQTGNIGLTWGGASIWRTAICTARSGIINSGDPQDGTATFNAAGSAGTTATALGITTAHDNADILVFEDNIDGSLHSGWSGSLTERQDFSGLGYADVVAATAGATGNYTVGVLSTFWTASAIALRDGSGGAPPAAPFTFPSRVNTRPRAFAPGIAR